MLEEFQNKFNIKVNYLHYFQLIAAIPLDLKRKALDSPVSGLLRAPSEYFQLKDRTIALTKFRHKNYYKLFIDTEPPAIRSWKNFLIGAAVLLIYMSLKDDKLRQFSFKVMHGIIPIKKEI